jgi:hypothetical protein
LGEDFYIVWFQQPGVADAALARDVRRRLEADLKAMTRSRRVRGDRQR